MFGNVYIKNSTLKNVRPKTRMLSLGTTCIMGPFIPRHCKVQYTDLHCQNICLNWTTLPENRTSFPYTALFKAQILIRNDILLSLVTKMHQPPSSTPHTVNSEIMTGPSRVIYLMRLLPYTVNSKTFLIPIKSLSSDLYCLLEQSLSKVNKCAL